MPEPRVGDAERGSESCAKHILSVLISTRYRHVYSCSCIEYLTRGLTVLLLLLLTRLIDDGTMLEASQVEHSYTPIGAARDKHVNTIGAEADIIDLLVVRDELRLGCQRRNIPYRTCRIN